MPKLVFAVALAALIDAACGFAYAIPFANSCMARGHGNGSSPYSALRPLSFGYEDGFMKNTLLKVYRATQNPAYLAYVEAGMAPLLLANGTIGPQYILSQYQLDFIEEGPSLLALYQQTQDAQYKTASEELIAQLDEQPTTSEGAYWHKETYPYQIWLDGLFMAEPFRAAFIDRFGASSAQNLSGVMLQFRQVEKHMRAPGNLLYHAYDEKRVQKWANSTTGCSPYVWGRAVGWYACALIDVLDFVPASSAEARELVGYVRRLAAGIVGVRDVESGLWWQLPADAALAGNYLESSSSAMFVYFLLKAGRRGFVEAEFVGTARDAYWRLVDRWVSWNASTGQWDMGGTVSVGSPK